MIAGPEPAWSADRANSMKKLQHPLKGVVEVLREAILRTDGEIGEEKKRNAPSLYTGPMKRFKPKEYKRYIVVCNQYRKDCVRLVFRAERKSGTSRDCRRAIMPTEVVWRVARRSTM